MFELMAAECGVTLHTQIAPDLPLICADRVRVRQVLHNLLANALRHTPSGGAILGLAIVKAVAEAHAGTVSAASAGLGQGSVFTLHLPAAVEADSDG